VEPVTRDLLDEQIEYYRARAPEYEEWFFRRKRYDRGEAHQRAWFAEVSKVEHALGEASPRGRILELACGTGLWTRHLAEPSECVVAVDASSEALALNERRVGSDKVVYVCADLFEWEPEGTFDFVFFGFWLSHVPPDRFDWFWSRLGKALNPGGRVFFVDSARNPASTAADQDLPGAGSAVAERRLNDGRRFRVVKVFYDPAALENRLAQLGWRASVQTSGEFFIYGSAVSAAPGA
jgi:2-polyprenyl-3-methyl-5-hydroxy-6-metoxy-1,4-benzoquinol methylase